MKNILLALLISIITTILQAQTPAFTWVKQFGGPLNEYAYSLAVDTAGNVYTTGFFQGTVDFDPGSNTFNLTSAGGGLSDIYISKVDASGNFVWATRIGGTSSDFGFALTLDKYSNLYLTGYFKSLADFDPGPTIFNLTPTGNFDVFIAKYDTDGNFVWAKKFDGSGTELCYAIHVDNFENVFTTGNFDSSTDFDPGVNAAILTPLGSTDIFISKLDSSGNFIWVKQIGGNNSDVSRGITVDTSANIYITGYFNGTTDFDPGTDTANLISAGMDDIFVSKLDASGNFLWAKQFGGTDIDYGFSLTTDASGNVFTTGYFNGTADFDPGADTTNLTSAGLDDIYISKLDVSGNLVWVKQMGSTSYDEAKYITMDTSSNLYITGSFNGTVDFDSGSDTTNLTSTGGDDVFICKMDTSGNFVWAKQLGGTANDYSYCVTTDASNTVYTAGFFQGTADFDPGLNTTNLVSAGGPDAFIHKMKQLTTSSIHENNVVSFVQLFPNPTTDQIHLVFEKQLRNANLRLINSIGQLVIEKKNFIGTDFSLDVSEQANGIFLLEIIQAEKISTIKFIKN